MEDNIDQLDDLEAPRVDFKTLREEYRNTEGQKLLPPTIEAIRIPHAHQIVHETEGDCVDAEYIAEVKGPKEATAVDEEQAVAFMKALADGKTAKEAAKEIHTPVKKILENPRVLEIMEWADLNAKQKRAIVLGTLTEIAVNGEYKERISAAGKLADIDSSLGLGNRTPHTAVQINIDTDLAALMDKTPEIKELE